MFSKLILSHKIGKLDRGKKSELPPQLTELTFLSALPSNNNPHTQKWFFSEQKNHYHLFVTETQLECLAGWREGRHRYLVVKMEDNHRTVDEDKYRCIMWDQVVEEGEARIFLSISQDASCNSLFSTREGRALVLYPG